MAAARSALLLAAIAGCAHVSSSTLCSNASFSSWFDSVLAEYERVQPTAPERTLVGLGLHLRHASVDEKYSEARLASHVYYDWIDNRLAWNVTEWGCDTKLVSPELIWNPLIHLMNDGLRNNEVTESAPARVTADGNVSTIVSLVVSVPITLELMSWPRDKQSVELEFASMRSIIADDLQFIIRSRQYSETKSNGAWEVVSVTSTLARQVSVFELSSLRGDGQHNAVMIKVVLKRRAAAHALAALAVLLAALIELAAATMIPPDFRTPMCACAAFTATLWLSSSLLRVPNAASTPLVLWMMGTVCVAAAAASLTAALVARVARLKATPPALVRRLLTTASSFCELTPNESTTEAERGAWAAAARLLDLLLNNVLRMVLFLVFCVYVFS